MADADLLDGADEELGAGGPHERDWKGIGTALLVILAICSLIGLAVYIFTPLSANKDFDLRIPAINELHLMLPPLEFFKWKDENSIVYQMNKRILIVDVRSNNSTQYIDSDLMQSHLGQVSKVHISHDFEYICRRIPFSNGTLNPEKQLFNFEIVHRTQKEVIRVGVSKAVGELQQWFVWAPAGNDYVFVQNGQIYYVEKPEATETLRISSGDSDKINGLLDWVYTEEIFDTKQGIWFSPSGRQIAFTTHNPNDVGKIVMETYRRGESYPTYSDIPYPKTNARFLPVYTLSLWDKKLKQAKELDVQLRDSISPHYLIAVEWVSLYGAERLVAVWANRYQNQVTITLCHFESARCYMVFEYAYRTKQWAMPSDYRNIQSSRDSIFVIVPKAKSDGNVYNHIVKLSIPDTWMTGGRARESSLSIGAFDVKCIVRLDADTDTIYFLAKAPNPGDSHLYSTKASPTDEDDAVVCRCVSCLYDNCTFQGGVEFAPGGRRLVVPCRGPGTPNNLLAVLNNGTLAKVTATMISEEYVNRTAKIMEPVTVDEEVMLDSGYVSRVKMWLPQDPQRGSKGFPVMLHVYGGPGWQSVTEEYKYPFEKWLCLNRSIAIVNIDARGSGGRGWKYRSPIYGALGTTEMTDQIETIKKLLQKHAYLDKTRVTVFGWSYGGFAAANIVEMAPEAMFKCAVSVAPVSNFLYYDATYTERYMGAADKAAYDLHDIVRNVGHFRGTRLLLMHGLYDDNVHFQNSALFIEELQKNMIDFDLMVYPNQDHGISVTRNHLYLKMYNFLNSCLH